MYMKKIDELIASNAKLAELLGRKEEEQEKECCNKTVLWVLAIIGAVAAVAAIAYGVYRHLNPNYIDDFDLDDYDDDLEEELEEETADTFEEEHVVEEEVTAEAATEK